MHEKIFVFKFLLFPSFSTFPPTHRFTYTLDHLTLRNTRVYIQLVSFSWQNNNFFFFANYFNASYSCAFSYVVFRNYFYGGWTCRLKFSLRKFCVVPPFDADQLRMWKTRRFVVLSLFIITYYCYYYFF